MSFADKVISTPVKDGTLAVFWLGQAGYIIKTPENKLIAIDLYLSDYCERLVGFKRIMAKILEPSELEFDVILASHAHPDHFDSDSIPFMMKNKTQVYCTQDCLAEFERLNIKNGYKVIKEGDKFDACGMEITAVPCDHGKDTPYAVGFLIRYGNKKIYFMGDTCFREDYFRDERKRNADLLLVPINGAFGNINETEAAETALGLSAKLTVPCHFWNFAEHEGNPYKFIKSMQEIAPNNKFYLMQMGEGIII